MKAKSGINHQTKAESGAESAVARKTPVLMKAEIDATANTRQGYVMRAQLSLRSTDLASDSSQALLL